MSQRMSYLGTYQLDNVAMMICFLTGMRDKYHELGKKNEELTNTRCNTSLITSLLVEDPKPNVQTWIEFILGAFSLVLMDKIDMKHPAVLAFDSFDIQNARNLACLQRLLAKSCGTDHVSWSIYIIYIYVNICIYIIYSHVLAIHFESETRFKAVLRGLPYMVQWSIHLK